MKTFRNSAQLLILCVFLFGGCKFIPQELNIDNQRITGTNIAPDATSTLSQPQSIPETSMPSDNPNEFAISSVQLSKKMVELVNSERKKYNLDSVEWDDLATRVGQAHAQEMADNQYMSHWDLSGYGPDIRYSLAGGSEWVQENVFSSWQRYDNGTPVPVTDWKNQIENAQESLMNSPGHRANILNPAHTHVGIGIAYNPKTGDFRVAQEFINRYVVLGALPSQTAPGSEITISFQLINNATDPVINLAYESFPSPLTMDQLNQTSTYSSPAEYVGYFGFETQADGSYRASVRLGDKPGFYHIRIWVNPEPKSPQAVDWVIVVK